MDRDLGPFREAVALLATIPGVAELTAEVVLSEIGPDEGCPVAAFTRRARVT